MANFEEKAGTVDFNTPHYKWTQTIEDVMVTVAVPQGTRAREVDVQIKTERLFVKLKAQPKAIIDGQLCAPIKPMDSIWTLEDDGNEKVLSLTLVKASKHESWKGLIKGEYELDPFTAEQMDKKMMLEKFQNENPGFDFSGAEFSGQVPKDPKNFMKFD